MASYLPILVVVLSGGGPWQAFGLPPSGHHAARADSGSRLGAGRDHHQDRDSGVRGRRDGVARPGRLRAATALAFRGEFSLAIAGLGSTSSPCPNLACPRRICAAIYTAVSVGAESVE